MAVTSSPQTPGPYDWVKQFTLDDGAKKRGFYNVQLPSGVYTTMELGQDGNPLDQSAWANYQRQRGLNVAMPKPAGMTPDQMKADVTNLMARLRNPGATTPSYPYFNSAGNPYKDEDTSYWQNTAENGQWYRGQKGGQIGKVDLPPWLAEGAANLPPVAPPGPGTGPVVTGDPSLTSDPAGSGSATQVSNPPVSYYNAQGRPYGSEDLSYWKNPAENLWYQGNKAGQVTPYGQQAPWEAQGTTPATQQSAGDGIGPLIQKLLSALGIGGTGSTGGTSFASLLQALLGGNGSAAGSTAAATPKSWLSPGVGYGDTQRRPTYFNSAGKPFRSGQDQESFWFNRADNKWYRGTLDGAVQEAGQLPWMQLPWMTQGRTFGPGQISYYNAQGRTFAPGDTKSYWYNENDKRWYEGLLDGTITAVEKPPWM